MSRITTEFELKIPGGEIILVNASGDIFEDYGRLWLDDVSYVAHLYQNADDPESRALTDREILKFDQWLGLEGLIDESLYLKFQETQNEEPEWQRSAEC